MSKKLRNCLPKGPAFYAFLQQSVRVPVSPCPYSIYGVSVDIWAILIGVQWCLVILMFFNRSWEVKKSRHFVTRSKDTLFQQWEEYCVLFIYFFVVVLFRWVSSITQRYCLCVFAVIIPIKYFFTTQILFGYYSQFLRLLKRLEILKKS